MTGRSDFQERRKARIQRLKAGAESARSSAAEHLAAAKRTADLIPFGQPILVGHHSEKRHRRDLERIQNNYAKGFEELKLAETLESRAEHAEISRAIHSDDPNAPAAIEAKIAHLEKNVEDAKVINRLIRSAKGDAARARDALLEKGFGPVEAVEKLLKPDFAGRVGFASYQLTNWNAEIRRLQTRLKILRDTEKLQAQPDEQIGDVILREANNRTQIFFPGKPCETVRSLLKSHGFRWAPSEGAWQRLANARAHYQAQRIAQKFTEMAVEHK